MIQAKIDSLLSEMSSLTAIEDKYRSIIEKGRLLPSLDEQNKNDSFLIEGCVSKAWLVPDYREEQQKLYFYADSEAAIVKGVMAILIGVYSGENPNSIIGQPGTFLEDAGVVEQLSMNRRNGLSNVLKQIQLYAVAFKTMHGL